MYIPPTPVKSCPAFLNESVNQTIIKKIEVGSCKGINRLKNFQGNNKIILFGFLFNH